MLLCSPALLRRKVSRRRASRCCRRSIISLWESHMKSRLFSLLAFLFGLFGTMPAAHAYFHYQFTFDATGSYLSLIHISEPTRPY